MNKWTSILVKAAECTRAAMLHEIISVAHHQSPCGVLFAQGKVKVVEREKRKQSSFFKNEASLDE